MEPNIGIKKGDLSHVTLALNKLLADEFVLYVKTRNAHWNVEGIDFMAKHLFFEGQYKEIDGIIDAVAERVRTLGDYATATLAHFTKLTQFTEQSREKNDSTGFIKELLADHESLIITLREHINTFANTHHDAGTSDFITGILEKHEDMAWKLRAHLA